MTRRSIGAPKILCRKRTLLSGKLAGNGVRGSHQGLLQPQSTRERPDAFMDSPARARGNLVLTVGRLQSSIRSRSTLMGSAEQPPIIERSQLERCIRRIWSFFGQLPICRHLIAFAGLLGLPCTPLCCASYPVIIDTLPHHKSPRYASTLVGQRNSHNIDVSATH
jgi:hypothetical protein